MGTKPLSKSNNTRVCGPDIVPRKDGDYYLVKEVDALLDAIGAGSVNGRRITTPSLEEVRAEFEEWYRSDYKKYINVDFRRDTRGQYIDNRVWHSWNAYRAAKGLPKD